MRFVRANLSTWQTGIFMLLFAALVALSLQPGKAFAEGEKKKVSKGEASVAMRSAKLYIRQRLYDKAIEQLEIAIAGKPDDPQAHFLLGELYSERGLVEEMDKAFKKVYTLKKGEKKFGERIKQLRETWWMRHYNAGVQSVNAQDFSAALESLQLAATAMPSRAETFKVLGIVYLQMGQTQSGIENLSKSIAMDSTDVSAFVNLGIAYLNDDNPQEAIKNYKKAHELAPEDVRILQTMSQAYQRAGDTKTALETAEKALKIDPEDLEVLTIAGQMYLVAGKHQRASELLEKVIEKQPENTAAVFNLAATYKKMDQLDKAIALFVKTLEADPNDHEAWYQLGLTYKAGKNYDGAIDAFKKFTDMRPAAVQGWQALGLTYAEKSQVLEEGTPEASECAKNAKEAFEMAQSLESQGGQ